MDLTDIYFYHHLPPTLADGDFWLVSCSSHSLVYCVWSLVLLPTDGCTPSHGRYVPYLLSSGVGRWCWLDHLRLSAKLRRLLPLLLHLPSSLSSSSFPSSTPPSSPLLLLLRRLLIFLISHHHHHLLFLFPLLSSFVFFLMTFLFIIMFFSFTFFFLL